MNNFKGPCSSNCPRRTRGDEKPNCHEICIEYLEFKRAIEEAKTQRREHDKEYRQYVDYKWRRK